MTPEQFATGLVQVVHDPSVTDTITRLERGPSGRRPPKRLVELSAWYQALPAADQDRLRKVVELAVHASLFGTLCVLDGVRTLEASTDFALFAVQDGKRVQLNVAEAECLHDEYQSQIYERVFGPVA
jgi:hypothetical protein